MVAHIVPDRDIAAVLTYCLHVDTADSTDKPKCAPTVYQVFFKEHMKKWNEENLGGPQEAIAHVYPVHPSLGVLLTHYADRGYVERGS